MSERQAIQRLIFRGSLEPAQVIVPTVEVAVAKDLKGVPLPVSDRPYARFDIREMRPLRVVKAGSREIGPNLYQRKESGFIIANFSLDALEGEARISRRQVQRAEQFKRVIEMTDAAEKSLDGGLDVIWNKGLVNRFRRITASWVERELVEEPLTRIAVEDISKNRLPNVENVMGAVNDLLRIHSFNLSDVAQEVDGILDPKPVKEFDTKPQEEIKKIKEEKGETHKKRQEEKKKVKEAIEDAGESVIGEYKGKVAKLEYTHDPVLDEPSKEAAEYLRRLLLKPF